MKILDFIEKTKLADRSEREKAKLLCFFHFKETGESVFSMPLISKLFVQCGFNVPNSSRLKTNLTKGKEKAFVNSKGKTATIEFIPAIFQSTEKEYAVLWEDNITIDSGSELIDEQKFVGKRKYLDQLIYQINHSYANNCYDAAVIQYVFGCNQLKSVMDFNMLTDDWKCISEPKDLFEMVRIEDIERLNATIPVEHIKLVATDGASRYIRDYLEEFNDETFAKWLSYHFATCERQDLIGATNHSLDILRKV